MTKPIPGPFTTEDIFEDGGVSIILDYPLPLAGNPVMIAHVFGNADEKTGKYSDERGDFTPEQALATARLFAAAPELLAAAKLADDFPELNLSNYDHDDVEKLQAWAIMIVLELDAAVAKAETENNS